MAPVGRRQVKKTLKRRPSNPTTSRYGRSRPSTTGSRAGGVRRRRRPLNNFMRFSQRQRQGVLRRQPNLGICDVARELGRMWRSMTAEQQAAYRR